MSDTNDDREALAWSAFLADEHSVAFRLFLRLALDGSAEAQRQVGLMHDQGKGVRQDHAQAARWYRTAADQGDAHAQHSLAATRARSASWACSTRPATGSPATSAGRCTGTVWRRCRACPRPWRGWRSC